MTQPVGAASPEESPKRAPRSPASLRRELWLLYLITLGVTAGLSHGQSLLGPLRPWLLVIVAATFWYLPIEVLYRKGEDPADLGIHRRRPLGALRAAGLLMLLSFPPYLLGFHVWQSAVFDRQLAPSAARFDRWPGELLGVPRPALLQPGELRLHTGLQDQIYVRWQLAEGERAFEATLQSDGPLTVIGGARFTEVAAHTLQIQGEGSGSVLVDLSGQRLSFEARVDGAAIEAPRLRLGANLRAADDQPYRAERSYAWLLNLILVQFLLVAVPEEVFYRGYLQSRLDGLVGRPRRILGATLNPTSVVLTSALFALGHIATVFHPARLAVFFPSLLFGWLRARTGGVLAPAIYHAASNILVEVAVLFYVVGA